MCPSPCVLIKLKRNEAETTITTCQFKDSFLMCFYSGINNSWLYFLCFMAGTPHYPHIQASFGPPTPSWVSPCLTVWGDLVLEDVPIIRMKEQKHHLNLSSCSPHWREEFFFFVTNCMGSKIWHWKMYFCRLNRRSGFISFLFGRNNIHVLNHQFIDILLVSLFGSHLSNRNVSLTFLD